MTCVCPAPLLIHLPFRRSACCCLHERTQRYEEDVRVPFLMAGPGVPRGVYVPEVAAAMTDLTATIAHLAGG
jgi:hypothetical protein